MNFSAPPKDYQVLFLDMNSFFATVEQQVQPTLRGVPVGVAPYTGNSGCIIAASREAKEWGVRICRVSEAKKLCPKIKILEARPALYMIYHKEIKRVIESFTPYFEPLSIDEFQIRLTPREQNYKAATELGIKIKQKIRQEVGDYLTCSVGIGPSKFLAKMAGERKKPDGLTVVRLSELKRFYEDLTLLDITGINFRMEARLNKIGINSPTQFFENSLVRLREVLNHPGRMWYFRLRGYEVDDFVSHTKTIGHSHVLAPEFRTKNGALRVIEKLINKTGYRLRKEKLWASGVSVFVNFMDRGGFHLSKSVPYFSDNKSLSQNVSELLRDCRWQSRPIYVSVSTFGLSQMLGDQISIFADIEKSRRISKALDQINDEYGADTILPASMYGTDKSAPDRIPFGQPRYEIIN